MILVKNRCSLMSLSPFKPHPNLLEGFFVSNCKINIKIQIFFLKFISY
jgi:hypothetical protein